MMKDKWCEPSESELSKFQQQLIPNLNNLDRQVRREVQSCLHTMVIANGDKTLLGELSRKGYLDEAPLLRSHLWKLMLESLDGNYRTWEQTRKDNSDLYRALRNKFLPSFVDEEDLLGIWESSFDQQLWDQIALDTKRTHSSLNFFQVEVPFEKVFMSKPTKHCDVLGRILYIWGKTNPTVRYVQGMNQILAPLYYLEFQSLEKRWWNRESEVFFMFSSVMSFVIDMHIKEMDDCESGIMGRMQSLNRFLRVVDGQLWQKMESEGIYPQYYSFRWLALLLAQQFGLNDTTKLWDHVLSYSGYKRFFFLDCCCLGILQIRKKQIMENDFISSLPKIQKLKDVEVENVLQYAARFYDQYKRKNIEKMYEQLISQNQKEQELLKQQSESIKQNAWSYGEIVKNTGAYLSKLAYWKKRE